MDIKNISYCSDYSKHSPKLNYGSRINHGHKFEMDLRAILSRYGIISSPTGRALLSPEFQVGLNYLDDTTSTFLRYSPDLVGQLPNKGGCILIEAKSALSRTGNYSVNTTSYIFQCDLVLNTDPNDFLRLLYVFPPLDGEHDYRAEWVQNLHRAIIRRVYDREILRTSRGSGLPYVLLAGDRLRRLSTVLKELIDSNEDQRIRNGQRYKLESIKELHNRLKHL